MGKQLRYLEIARIIREKIKAGEYPPGKGLPSQKELSDIFSTSIMTARQALGVLEEEGLITVIHGIGTFAASSKMDTEDIGLQGFQNEMDRRKMKIVNRIVDREYALSNSRLKGIFGGKETSFSCLTRLRTMDGKPVILQKSWVADGMKEVIRDYRSDDSLYRSFMEKTGIMITLGHEIASPVILDGKELELLELKEKCPAFLSRRISIGLDDQVLIYDEAWLPGPNIIMASKRQGKNNNFKYILSREENTDPAASFSDKDLWEDLK